jgi:hypothetical protein
MKTVLIALAVPCLLAMPALAQQMEVTCGDYSMMDNAQQMETIAKLEAETSQMTTSLTAEEIHTKLAAECQDQVDMLIIDVVKGS